MLNRMNEWLKINQSLEKSQMYYDKNPQDVKQDLTEPKDPILYTK